MSMFSKNKRLLFSLLFTALIASIFWSQSRIPALNEKAQMGLRNNFNEIAFEIILPVSHEHIFLERVIRSSINWAYTNLYGMTFGLLFAAGILTILGCFRRKTFKRPWLNTLFGAFLGAPLGVCVNCATPIALGIYSAGSRLETALATLASSPTLNIIVLAMAFSLLPWEMAVIKVFGVLIFLCTIPFLVKHISKTDNVETIENISANKLASELPSCSIQENINESYLKAFTFTSRTFIKNLFFITKFALPLMILAGFLGAFVIELVPFDLFSSSNANLLTLTASALIATILPVPIAFDVVIVMALLSSGIDKGIAMTLLFALGIYSIYPAFIIARYISIKLSIAMAVLTIFIATGLGVTTQYYFEHKIQNEQIEREKGLALANKAIYKNTLNICSSLPKNLHPICFEQHLEKFENIVSTNLLCERALNELDINTCKQIVESYKVKQKALLNNNPEHCSSLSSKQLGDRCINNVITKIAIKEYDINICNKATNEKAFTACKDKYLNSNLLFNPDGSACDQTSGKELFYCQTNAEIYLLTDALNIEGCNKFKNHGAKEHCRYTVASAMIGKHNDSSACKTLESSQLRSRCESLSHAWKAYHDSSLKLCSEINIIDIQNICFLRIADKKINYLLTNYSLSTIEEDIPNRHKKEQIYTKKTQNIADSPTLNWQETHIDKDITISYASYNKTGAEPLNTFRKHSADEFGIHQSWLFRATDFFEPFIIGKGIASGDYNNDYWPDLLLATAQGVLLYKNIGGNFQNIKINQEEMKNANIFLVAFVDTDNDGHQDIFASSYGGKNFIFLNKDGQFNKTKLITLEEKQRLTMSAGFGDINLDGQLDIALGNWSSGAENLFSTTFSENLIMYRENESYRSIATDSIKGETNSILVADINNDNYPDVLIGNDRLVPDIYFINDGSGKLAKVTNKKTIPTTSMFTMSMDSFDFNNDLKTDLFNTDMTFSRSKNDDYCSPIENTIEKEHCYKMIDTFDNFQKNNINTCNNIENPIPKQECYITFSIKAAKELKQKKYCDKIPDNNSAALSLCRYLSEPTLTEEIIDQESIAKQIQKNTLLVGHEDKFIEKAEELGMHSSYWSWNAKAADLDNDGWQDIYVGNGFHFGDNFYEIQENILYHNIKGKRFEQRQKDWGLNDTINTPSYTYLDLDLDGDLDIITTGVLASPRIYINHLSKKNSVTFILNDEKGNSFGIGAKITIYYGNEKSFKQRKENKLSSGFLSFDNPVIHFGIDDHQIINKFTIQWPDGSTTNHNHSITASGIYRIKRSTTIN